MMVGIITQALRHRGIVAVLSLVLLLYGAILALQSRLDVLPEFVPPQVTVQTEAPGLAPEQVEALVTLPVERALSGIPATARVTSESITGLSVVTVVFEDSADILVARQGVAEHLAELTGRLPVGVAVPRMSPLTSSTMDLLKIGLQSKTVSPRQLRDLADWELRPRLLAVPGVARITVFGGEQREVQILLDEARLAAADLTASDVLTAARAATGLRGSGQIDLEAQRIPISTGLVGDPVQLVAQAVVVTRGDTTIHVADVAQVQEGAAIAFGDAVIQGRPGVLLAISGQYGANTLEATHAVEAALAEELPRLQARGVEVYPALHRPASFIETALRNLTHTLAIGAFLIAIVLYAFLRDWRSALIAFMAIPLSLLAAVVVLSHFNVALNTMTLGGFAVALGVLVDDAVIYLENILRRLRENAATHQPQPRLIVIRDASLEISAAVIFATGVILLVLLPVFLMPGVQGKFMLPLAQAFALAVVASLIVALTVTPALAALLLRAHEVRREPAWLSKLRRWHLDALRACTRQRGAVLVTLGVLLAGVIVLSPFLAGEFMPSFREGHFVAQVTARVPGTSLGEMSRLGEQISAEILKLPYIATVELQIGRAEQGEDTWGPERSEFHIELKPDRYTDQEQSQQELRELFARYPAVQSEVLTFLGDRVSESLSGETAQGVIRVRGGDMDAIDRATARLVGQVGSVSGIADVQVAHAGLSAELSVNLLPARLALYGLRAGDVLDALETAFAGTVVNQVYAGNRAINIVALLPPAMRADPQALRRLPLRSANGQFITLEDVAQIYIATSRAAIRHEGSQRIGVITFNAGTRGIQPVTRDVQSILARDGAQHRDTWTELAGEAEQQQRTQRDLIVFSLVALVLIVLVLSAAFERRALALIVLVNVPFSLIGAVLALAGTGQSFSLGALVGLVTVFGISARNAILLLAHCEKLLDDSAEGAWTPELIDRGAAERLLPVIMTAVLTALGLVPLAASLGTAGNEIEGPLAIAVLGGLLSSTVLCLVVLPALMHWITTSRFSRLVHLPAETL
ncbi:MAG TPA: efflux RND transporter permease subunit [Steroidobacteraceae bacterium]|nr:efflux RND transporter permease subunit [Steroidobacteraceae bacterium]